MVPDTESLYYMNDQNINDLVLEHQKNELLGDHGWVPDWDTKLDIEITLNYKSNNIRYYDQTQESNQNQTTSQTKFKLPIYTDTSMRK